MESADRRAGAGEDRRQTEVKLKKQRKHKSVRTILEIVLTFFVFFLCVLALF